MLKKGVSVLFVFIWIMTLFTFSEQQGEESSSTSKKVSQIIVNIIDIKHKYEPEQTQRIVSNIEPYIRKLAHYTIYTLGGILLINALRYFLIKENQKIVISFICRCGVCIIR